MYQAQILVRDRLPVGRLALPVDAGAGQMGDDLLEPLRSLGMGSRAMLEEPRIVVEERHRSSVRTPSAVLVEEACRVASDVTLAQRCMACQTAERAASNA